MTDQSHEQPEKKIFIDEDWKSRVQAEKEQAEHERSAPHPPEDASRGPLPPPTLTLLATTLGMQAMVAMGLVPDPASGKTQLQLNQARHLIDTIQLLQDKTQGNRTPDETSVLERLLHDLRMGYVAVAEQSQPKQGV
jgi:hypothetical protein